MIVLSAYVCMLICMQYLRRPEEGKRYPGMGVTDAWELLCAMWVLGIKLVCPEEQPVLLTMESSHYSLIHLILTYISHMRENVQYLSFSVKFMPLNIIISGCICFPANLMVSFSQS